MRGAAQNDMDQISPLEKFIGTDAGPIKGAHPELWFWMSGKIGHRYALDVVTELALVEGQIQGLASTHEPYEYIRNSQRTILERTYDDSKNKASGQELAQINQAASNMHYLRPYNSGLITAAGLVFSNNPHSMILRANGGPIPIGTRNQFDAPYFTRFNGEQFHISPEHMALLEKWVPAVMTVFKAELEKGQASSDLAGDLALGLVGYANGISLIHRSLEHVSVKAHRASGLVATPYVAQKLLNAGEYSPLQIFPLIGDNIAQAQEYMGRQGQVLDQ